MPSTAQRQQAQAWAGLGLRRGLLVRRPCAGYSREGTDRRGEGDLATGAGRAYDYQLEAHQWIWATSTYAAAGPGPGKEQAIRPGLSDITVAACTAMNKASAGPT